MVAKTTKQYTDEYKLESPSHLENKMTVYFDTKGLGAHLDEITGTLSFHVPAVEFHGPIFTESAMEAFERCGMTPHEIDGMIDDIFNKCLTKGLAKMLAERRKR